MKSFIVLLTLTLGPQLQPGHSTGDRPVGTTGSTLETGDIRMPTGRVEAPSRAFRSYHENGMRVSVPANWREVQSTDAVTFAPDGAYGARDGRTIITHGIAIGFVRDETRELRTATDELIGALAGGNTPLSRPSQYDRTAITGAAGLHATLSNVSDA